MDVRLEALSLLNQLSDTFLYRNKDSFRLAGVFRNRSDLLFSDGAESIHSLSADTSFREALGDFLPILQDNDPISCGAESQEYRAAHILIILLSTVLSRLFLGWV